jgi:Flp pilus assembly pilin Flp
MDQRELPEALVTRFVPRFRLLAGLLRRECGQTMSEYAVVLGVLIVGVAATVLLFANGVHTLLQTSIMSILNGV